MEPFVRSADAPEASPPPRPPRPSLPARLLLGISVAGLVWAGLGVLRDGGGALGSGAAFAQGRGDVPRPGRLIGGARRPEGGPGVGVRVFEQVEGLVRGQYVDTVSADSMALAAARALVAQLKDPYSEVLPPRQIDQLNKQLGERYGGIGVSLEPGDTVRGPAIVQVFAGSPAAGAGLEVGDRILAVNDTTVRTWALDQVTARITGPLGTSVQLLIQRPGGPPPRRVSLTRATIQVSSLGAAYLDATGTAVLQLTSFGGGAAAEVADTLAVFEQRGAKRLVLDLRGNPGGRLEEATALADLFLDEGRLLARIETRPGADQGAPQQFADPAPARFTLQMAVLVDEGSASASEIVTGALQDHDRALVLGWPTFGKGLVQTIFPLEGGYALKLTTGKWITPSGRSIHRDRAPGDTVLAGQAADTANRPVVRSSAGRALRGGGGIVPDILLLQQDTLTRPEQLALRTLKASPSRVRDEILDVVRRDGVAKGCVLPEPLPARWSETVLARLTAAGLVAADQTATLQPVMARWIEDLVVPLSADESALYQRRATTDRVFQDAVRRLRAASTTQALLGLDGRQVGAGPRPISGGTPRM